MHWGETKMRIGSCRVGLKFLDAKKLHVLEENFLCFHISVVCKCVHLWNKEGVTALIDAASVWAVQKSVLCFAISAKKTLFGSDDVTWRDECTTPFSFLIILCPYIKIYFFCSNQFHVDIHPDNALSFCVYKFVLNVIPFSFISLSLTSTISKELAVCFNWVVI